MRFDLQEFHGGLFGFLGGIDTVTEECEQGSSSGCDWVGGEGSVVETDELDKETEQDSENGRRVSYGS